MTTETVGLLPAADRPLSHEVRSAIHDLVVMGLEDDEAVLVICSAAANLIGIGALSAGPEVIAATLKQMRETAEWVWAHNSGGGRA